MTTHDFADATWRKSSRSGAESNCVEMAATAHMVGVRDSKHIDGPILTVGRAAWADFLTGVKAGDFDRA